MKKKKKKNSKQENNILVISFSHLRLLFIVMQNAVIISSRYNTGKLYPHRGGETNWKIKDDKFHGRTRAFAANKRGRLKEVSRGKYKFDNRTFYREFSRVILIFSN